MGRRNIKPCPLTPEPAGKINVTDPDSRNLKTTRGWVQGYNAQAVVGEGQIVLAAEISVESLDTANLQPLVTAAIGELEAAGVQTDPGSCWPTPATQPSRAASSNSSTSRSWRASLPRGGQVAENAPYSAASSPASIAAWTASGRRQNAA